MSNMMKALVKAKPEPGIWMDNVPVPEVGPNDVLIKVKKSAICGTDVHIHQWDEWAAATIPVPMVVGHEFMGEIVVSVAVKNAMDEFRTRAFDALMDTGAAADFAKGMAVGVR